MQLKIIIVALAALFAGCRNEQKSIKETPVTFKREAGASIYRDGTLIAGDLHIEIADTPYERQTGLMYRESMEKNQGMWFVFGEESPRYFYMKNTLIPLDLLYAGKDHKIVSIIKNAQPLSETSLPSEAPAMYVLELNGGIADQWDIRVGDSIVITP